MNKGKEKCENLKKIRKAVAEKHGLEYSPSECHHEGDCQGTCPKCDAEAKSLQEQLDQMEIISFEPITDENGNPISSPFEEEEIIIDEQDVQGDITMGIFDPMEESPMDEGTLISSEDLGNLSIGDEDYLLDEDYKLDDK